LDNLDIGAIVSTKDWIRFSALGLIWGSSFLWIKIAVHEISPAMLVSFRALFAALGLVIILYFSRTAGLKRDQWKTAITVFFLLGLFNIALPIGLISWAEQYIDSGMASILNSTVPLFTIMIAPLFLKDDQFSIPKFVGLIVGFLGVILVFSPELGKGFNQNIAGQGAMLLGAVSYAGAGVYARVKTKEFSAQMQSFLQLIMATAIMWVFTLAFDRPLVLPSLPITWVALLWLGLLGSCVGTLLFFQLLHSVGPTRTVLVTYIFPLVGVILGAIFLQERLYWQALAGGLLIISGIAIVNIRNKKGVVEKNE
jgi:drug/metabolite transporter (DMT)-like permease